MVSRNERLKNLRDAIKNNPANKDGSFDLREKLIDALSVEWPDLALKVGYSVVTFNMDLSGKDRAKLVTLFELLDQYKPEIIPPWPEEALTDFLQVVDWAAIE